MAEPRRTGFHRNPNLISDHATKLHVWASQNILAGLFNKPFLLSEYGHILGKTLCSGPRRRPGRQAHGQEHRPSSSAPCAVPMILSRIGQYIKNEPCAKRRALLGVSSSRYSSVSRGIRSAWSIFLFTFSM
jgi:hypothetical protein